MSFDRNTRRTSSGYESPLARQGFNPQPEPPVTSNSHDAPGSREGFNPQPEPPAYGGPDTKGFFGF
jgi:hypothetical protein